MVPQEIIDKYSVQKLKCDDYIYIEIQKGMYGLKQAGALANEHLEQLLKRYGYVKIQFIPGVWKHKTRSIILNSCVDDFTIKYAGQQHADHLISLLSKHHEEHWKGDKYCGMDLK